MIPQPLNPPLYDLVTKLMTYNYAYPFVNLPFAQDYPSYYKIVKTPMCLSIMKDKAQNMQNYTLAFLKEDMRQIVENCILFNRQNSQIVSRAQQLSRKFDYEVKKLLVLIDGNHLQMAHQQTKPEPQSPKSLLKEVKPLISAINPVKTDTQSTKASETDSWSRVDTLANIIYSQLKQMPKIPQFLTKKAKVKIQAGSCHIGLVIDLEDASRLELEKLEHEMKKAEGKK